MEYPGLSNKTKTKEKVSDVITVNSVTDLPYNSKSGSIAEVTGEGVKELKIDELLSNMFYIPINNTNIGDIAYNDNNKFLSILNNLEAVYYDLNNLKRTIPYKKVAILNLIYREYEIYGNALWKNLNNIKIFVVNKNTSPYIYNGTEWEPMDYVQKSDFVFDSVPTEGSSNLVTSETIYNLLNSKADLVNGKVPSDLLPSYVDDVLEFSRFQDFPRIGESGKIYIDISANTSYRWTGSIYKEIQSPIELDEYPILNSNNAIESGGVYSALLEKLDVIPDLSEIRLKAETALQTETDPTVPDWAKLETKPSYTASEVGALPNDTIIPDDLSDLNDDATHRLVTDAEKTTWNNKQDALVSGTSIKTINSTSLLGSGDIAVQAPLTFDSTPTEASTNPVTSDGIASKFNNYVTLDTSQNVTGEKTFVGAKKIKFKKSTANDKLGFTLYDNNNKELSYLEYNTGDLCLGSYYSSSSLHVKSRAGFKMSDVSSGVNAVYRILTPYAADAKTPFNLTSTISNFYFPLGVSNGITTLVTNSTGLLDISSFFNNYYTKTDTDTLLSGKQSTLVSGTDIKTINGNTLLGSGNVYLNDAAISYDGNAVNVLEDATNVQEALDLLDTAVSDIELNLITSITTSESSASGGNNTVTITETNGTSHTFNVKNGIDGQDGADGVSLGEIALVQTTGDATDTVMSQKAVTEYGRKVTAEDLAGTSDWIKAKLTEEGWEFGKTLTSTGGLTNNTATCVTDFIPMSDFYNHNITIVHNAGNRYICWYDENKTFVRNATVNNSYTGDFTNAAWQNAKYVRLVVNPNQIPLCYIRDNTTGEHVWEGLNYLYYLCDNNNINLNTYRTLLVEQETGESVLKTMSQKAITDAVNYNVNIEQGKGFTLNSISTVRYFKLTPKATTLLNASDKMSFMFSTKGTGGYHDYRYFQFGNGSSSSDAVDTSGGACLIWSYSKNLSANGVSYTLNQTGSNMPTPDVWIVTWDRINGIVKFYDHATLVNTLSGDNYKKNRFVNESGLMCLRSGDNNVRIYDIRLFDYDISYVMNDADIKREIVNLEGAGILTSQFLGNYKRANNDASFFSETNSFQGGGYSATCTYSLNGDDYHIVVKDGVSTTQACGGKPYYIGTNNKAQLEILEFEVVSGVIKTSYDGHTTTIFYQITDENGDEVVDYNNIGVGKYTLTRTKSAAGARFDFYKVSGNVEVIMNRVMQYRPISCVFHLRGDTMYNKKFYDDQTNSFITLYSDRTCGTEYRAHTMVMTPQRVIRQNISSADGLPHYPGEMAVVGNNVYIGLANYTWKQINNS